MRKKSMAGHNGGAKRYNGGRGGNNNNNRPRKNYGALREKYLNQARDALSGGDRVLAENYFQHADHYYRMQAEENERRAQWQQNNQQNNQQSNGKDAAGDDDNDSSSYDDGMDDVPAAGSLPAFLTQPQKVANGDSAAAQAAVAEWEE